MAAEALSFVGRLCKGYDSSRKRIRTGSCYETFILESGDVVNYAKHEISTEYLARPELVETDSSVRDECCRQLNLR